MAMGEQLFRPFNYCNCLLNIHRTNPYLLQKPFDIIRQVVMGYKNNSSALLGAAENIINYKNPYDQWIITSTIEACIVHQYSGLDHDPKKLPTSLARELPCCDEFTFTNMKGIYRWTWKKLHYWYFYKNPNDHDQPPAYPDNNKDQ